MLFRLVGALVLFFVIVFFFWGDHVLIMHGDFMFSIDYPLSSYRSYERVLTDFPKSRLRKTALKKMKALTKDNHYLKELLEKYEKTDTKMKKIKKMEKAKKYH
ncbi:hypothetical protein ACFL35_00120 [Candidatus Riflebacteria bacterium]